MFDAPKLKALTIWQPWASLIICGVKAIENRTWAPPEWLLGKRIVIHAAKAWNEDNIAIWEKNKHLLPSQEIPPLGAILGSARLASVITPEVGSCDPWYIKCFFGWVLDEIEPLTPPIKWQGSQGLWNVPENFVHVFTD